MTMAAMIRAATESGTFAVLTHRAYRELSDALGVEEQAMCWLLKQATRTEIPIAINFLTSADPNGPITTITIAPKGWSQQRLAGWIGARHVELEAVFGTVERIYGPSEAVG